MTMKSLKVFTIAGAALVFALVLGPRAGLGAEAKTAGKPPLVIPAQGFSFSVQQPDGWQADEQAMKKYQANLAFAPKSGDGKEPDVTIVVRALRKLNENVALSLETDKQAYRQKEPAVQFGPLEVKHPLYATFPQLFSKPGEFYVYTAYLNPKGFTTYFSVVMPKKKSAATPRELAAYKEVLESLRIIPAETESDSE
jgi:hypothetical protein